MPKDPLEYVEVSYAEWMLCGRIGAPRTSGHTIFYVPRWVKELVGAFGTAESPNWTRVLVGVPSPSGEARAAFLVAKIIREGAFDLAEVRAALRLGGPEAALQLAADAQDGAHEQALPQN